MKRIFGFLLLSVFLFSCSDSIDSHGSNFLLTEKPYILKGSVKYSDNEELSGRMAIPATPDIAEYLSDTEYTFEVWHNGTLKDVTFDTSGNFSLQLNTGDNEIKIEVEKKVESSPVDCITILRSTETITIGANSPHVLSKNFVLKKLQTEGKKGNVKLEINCSNAGVDYVTATLVETDPTKISNWQNALGIDDGTLISEAGVNGTWVTFPSGDAPLSINSGSYRVKFDFYDNYDNKNILYSRIQTIEVYDGLLTDKWYEAGVDQPGPVETFIVNGEAVSAFVNATVYVDPVNGDDDNGGSYYGKFKTLQKALNTVDARNKKVSGEEFNIFLSGDFTDQDPVFLNQESGVLKLNIKSDSDTQRVITGKSGQSSSVLFKINGRNVDNTIVNLENIRITGQTNTSDTDNGGGIYVEKATLTLTKCTIDSNNANYGAGIYIADGIVKLGNGSKITGNTATYSGGGVYNKGIFFMYGSSLIGDSATSTTLASDSSGGYANKAETGGGIYNNGGNVYIGYDSAEHEYPIESDTNTWYGIRRNFSTANGAGIYHQSGTLKIASGDISYNYVNSNDPSFSCYGGAVYLAAGATVSGGTFTGNKAKNGGAFYITSGKKLTIDGNAVITKNTAENEGGGICNLGTLTMAAGTIGGSGAQNTAGESGGAVYQSGTFNVSGSATIYTGSSKTNDVYLPNGKVVTINNTYSGSGNNVSNKMALTPQTWKRGNDVLGGSKKTATNSGYFKTTDSEWNILNDTNFYGMLDAELWVDGTTESGTGTYSKPYKTVNSAVNACWSSDRAFTINIKGMVSGNQTVPAATTAQGLAKSFTIKGNSTSAALTAGGSGTALTINTTTLVNISSLIIKGGNVTGNGGGLYLTASGTKVNLGSNVKIFNNVASENGGGVYAVSGSILCLNGGAIVGNKDADRPSYISSTPSDSNGYNKAKCGGGIYCLGTLGLGKLVNENGTISDASSSDCYIAANIATETGAGIYISGNNAPQIKTAYIQKNYASEYAGGMYCGAAATISAGNFEHNKAKYGGALATQSGNMSYEISGGTFNSNAATNNGGAVYSQGKMTISGGSFTSNGANIYGGAIYHSNSNSVIVGKATFTSNTASTNGGGAIYSISGLNINDSGIKMTYGNQCGKNDIQLADDKKVSVSVSSLTNHTKIKPIYIGTSNMSGKTVLGGSYGVGLYRSFNSSIFGKMIDSAGIVRDGGYVTSKTEAESTLNQITSDPVTIAVEGSSPSLSDLATITKTYSARSIILDLSGSSFTAIGQDGFSGCTGLYSIKLPKNLSTPYGLGSGCFAGCSNLTSVYGLENFMGQIPGRAFANCEKISSLNISKCTKFYKNTFEGWKTNQLVNIGTGTFTVKGGGSYTEVVDSSWKPTNSPYMYPNQDILQKFTAYQNYIFERNN